MSARGAGWGAPAELGIARQGHGQASDQFYMWALAYVHPQPNGVVIELASQQTIGLVSAHALPNPKVGAGNPEGPCFIGFQGGTSPAYDFSTEPMILPSFCFEQNSRRSKMYLGR